MRPILHVISIAALLRASLIRALIATLALSAVFAPNVSGMLTPQIEESKSPVESDEEADECVAHRRIRVSFGRYNRQLRQTVRKAPLKSCLVHSVQGHRLSNGLRAPLTC